MSKYYLSKSSNAQDQSEAASVDPQDNKSYAILLNSSQVKFFKNGSNFKNLNGGGYSQPTKSTFSNLGSAFTKFFSGDNVNPVVTAQTNAFAYMRENRSDAVIGGWPV